ncbi:hypothetical protein FRB99_004490 [Tulasnella sp. 403]|nr:hypothetical protein FRB99_004490 [Tulasnella sp. 403]
MKPFTSTDVPVPHTDQTLKQDLWPDHCVQGTHGGDLEAGVQERLDALKNQTTIEIIQKGSNKEIDSYSAFADNAYQLFTPLSKVLFSNGIERIVVVGLATDYCVRATVIDARKFGIQTTVVTDGIRAVFPDRTESVLEELRGWGAAVTTLQELRSEGTKGT